MFFTALALFCLLLPAAPAAADLEGEVRQIVANAGLDQTTVSILLYDLADDSTLVGIDPDRPMMPASNLKLLTTAAALDRLGPEFVFSTDLDLLPPTGSNNSPTHADAEEPRDEASGSPLPDLQLRGSGDPGLGDSVLLQQRDLKPDDILDRWVDAVVQTGHTHFGTLVLDDRIFDLDFINPGWPTNQLNNWYCAQVAGLNFHANVLDILYLPAPTRGEAPTIQVYPWFPKLATVNRAVTGTNDAFWIKREPTANRFTFGGQVRNARSQPLRTTVYDPPIFLGELLRHRLEQKGVTVDRLARPAPSDAPRNGQTLYRVNTTLAGVLDRTNQDSHNLFAEALFKRLGFELTGQPGSFTSGSAAIRMFLQQRLGSRIQVATNKSFDGSGLSRENATTARILVETLRYMHRHENLRDLYRSSLATAGKTGTLKHRGKKLQHAAVHAKSGYISGVSALSGYLVFPDEHAQNGQHVYAFSMIFNGFSLPVTNTTLKKLQDRLLATFDQALNPQALAY